MVARHNQRRQIITASCYSSRVARYTTPKTVSDAIDAAGNLGAKLINNPQPGTYGITARKCLSVIKKVKQIALIIDRAYPSVWSGDVRAARLGYCPTTNAEARTLWILSRAVRDLHTVITGEPSATDIRDIKERQLNGLAVFEALAPRVTADASAALSDGGKVESTRSMGQSMEPSSSKAKPGRLRRIH